MTEAERQELKETSKAIGQLTTDVAVLKLSNEKIIEPSLRDINDKLDRLNFYTKEEVDGKLLSLQKKRWYENSLSASFGALLTTIIIYFVNKLMNGGQ